MKKTATVLLALIFVSLSVISCQRAKEPEGKKETQTQKQEVQIQKEEGKQQPPEAKPENRAKQQEQPTAISGTREKKKGEEPKGSKPEDVFLKGLKSMQIAYVPDGDVWVMRGDGSDKKKITNNGNVTILFGWSYDDTRLLFGTGKLEFDPVGNIISGYKLWVLEVETKKMIFVMNGDQILKAEWSPKEATFFVAKLDESLWLLNENATDAKKIIDSPVGSPRWSPNGEKIAYEVSPPVVGDADPEEPHLGWSHIWILDVKTRAKKQITESGINRQPRWLLDGSKIVIFKVTGKYGEGENWLYDLRRGKNIGVVKEIEVKTTTDKEKFKKSEVIPAPSGVLEKIYQSQVIYFVRIDLRREYSDIHWSSDYKAATFVTSKGEIYVGDSNGENLTKIADMGNYPVWSRKEAGK